MLPGVALRLPVSSSVGPGARGGSGDQQTLRFLMPLAFNSFRITRHRGQTEVSFRSEIRNSSGWSLFPVPIEEIRGMECLSA